MTRALDPVPYTNRQWFWAVNLCGALGSSAAILQTVLPAVVYGGETHMLAALPIYLFFGLPAGLLLAWVFVAYPLSILMRKPVNRLRAAFWGAGIGAFMAGVWVLLSRLNGLRISRDDSVFSQIGGDGAIRSLDGILTPYGRWMLAQNVAWFVLACAICAVVVQALIGEGQRQGERP